MDSVIQLASRPLNKARRYTSIFSFYFVKIKIRYLFYAVMCISVLAVYRLFKGRLPETSEQWLNGMPHFC